MTTISARLQAVRARMEAAARSCGRDPQTIALVAVSKTWPAQRVREAAAAGQRAFGENYVQEALAKMERLSDLDLEWHFVGRLQGNKAGAVAAHFDWVHSIDRLEIAQRLSRARPPERGPLEVCIEVNVSGEASKGGVAPEAAAGLARSLAALPGLRLRGLMAIPEPAADAPRASASFRRLRELRDRIAHDGYRLDTLSRGMSDDFEAAILEGATLVRVGSAIFGPRAAAARVQEQ
ncbi:MAG: YggS family pyridoxal phosphate-dependent enzyme [Rhodocyclales bacterium CG_4_10_14_3_um_filter_68_10]|nr:MAG: YggS family pyridoxal phosphate-dependent enzyme [Rhodocyclales bacterium CG_4_10_14_3_um_filter_68_10]